MKLEADARIAFPRDLVFRTYRDRLPELAAHLPDIKSIRVDERKDEGDRSELVNSWEAETKIPKVAQAVIKPEMLTWLDFATWNLEDYSCEWRIQTRMFTEQVRCGGRNVYVEDGEATILKIRGDLEVDLKGIPGVPGFLAGRVRPHVERFVVDLLTPNLLSVAGGLEAFLRLEASKS